MCQPAKNKTTTYVYRSDDYSETHQPDYHATDIIIIIIIILLLLIINYYD